MKDLEIKPALSKDLSAKICVIGIGSAGGNAVDYMIRRGGIEEVDFITANTDAQALEATLANIKIVLGEDITKGLGAGWEPDVARQAAEESIPKLKELLKGYDLIVLAAGAGGGTGTGATPVIAKGIKELDALAVGIITKCSIVEGNEKYELASQGIEEMEKYLDSIIVVENDVITSSYPEMGYVAALEKANDILYNTIRGVVNVVSKRSYINMDMNDVRKVLKNAGRTIIGIGIGKGEHAPKEALKAALNSPFFDKLTLKSGARVLLSMEFSPKYSARKMYEAMRELQDISGGVNVKLGMRENDECGDEVIVTILAPAQYNDSDDNVKNTNNENQEVLKDVKKTNGSIKDNSSDFLFDNSGNDTTTIRQEYLPNSGTIRINAPKIVNEDMQVLNGYLANNKQFVERPRDNEQLKILDIPTWERQGLSNAKHNIEKNVQHKFDSTYNTNIVPVDDMNSVQNLVNQSSANSNSKNKMSSQIVSNKKQ